MGFFAGSVNNLLGPRLTFSLGTTGYSLYIGSLWAFQLHGTRWFLILAGAILGVSKSAHLSFVTNYRQQCNRGGMLTRVLQLPLSSGLRKVPS